MVADLWRLTQGNWPAFLSALYAGALPAAALSIIVGSVHYCCFCATRRALVDLTAANSSKGSAAGAAGQEQHVSQHVIVSHGATGTHFLPLDEPLDGKDEEEQQQQLQAGQLSAASGTTSTAAAAAAAGVSGDGEAVSVQVAEGSLLVNCVSAVITAALTALVESPLELFRHNSQAGHIQGNFLTEMWKVSRQPWGGSRGRGRGGTGRGRACCICVTG